MSGTEMMARLAKLPPDRGTEATPDANARLIAAAPSLLSALESLMGMIVEAGKLVRDVSMDMHPDWYKVAMEITQAVGAAQAAINAAKGAK